jgi:hypothetical protein
MPNGRRHWPQDRIEQQQQTETKKNKKQKNKRKTNKRFEINRKLVGDWRHWGDTLNSLGL